MNSLKTACALGAATALALGLGLGAAPSAASAQPIPTTTSTIHYALDMSCSMDWGTSSYTTLDGNTTSGARLSVATDRPQLIGQPLGDGRQRMRVGATAVLSAASSIWSVSTGDEPGTSGGVACARPGVALEATKVVRIDADGLPTLAHEVRVHVADVLAASLQDTLVDLVTGPQPVVASGLTTGACSTWTCSLALWCDDAPVGSIDEFSATVADLPALLAGHVPAEELGAGRLTALKNSFASAWKGASGPGAFSLNAARNAALGELSGELAQPQQPVGNAGGSGNGTGNGNGGGNGNGNGSGAAAGEPIPTDTTTIFYVIDTSCSMGWDSRSYVDDEGNSRQGNRIDAGTPRTKAAWTVPPVQVIGPVGADGRRPVLVGASVVFQTDGDRLGRVAAGELSDPGERVSVTLTASKVVRLPPLALRLLGPELRLRVTDALTAPLVSALTGLLAGQPAIRPGTPSASLAAWNFDPDCDFVFASGAGSGSCDGLVPLDPAELDLFPTGIPAFVQSDLTARAQSLEESWDDGVGASHPDWKAHRLNARADLLQRLAAPPAP